MNLYFILFRFAFDGREIKMNLTCGFFVTM